jgi:hypothetical protein
MNIKELLKEYNQEQVNTYINYCSKLQKEKKKDGTLKNQRATKITPEKFAELYKKVAQE